MTTVGVPWFSGSRDAERRFAWALGLSVATHLLLIESFVLETALRPTQGAAPATLTVRIEPPAKAEHEGLPVTVPAPLPVAARDRARGIEHAASARAKQGSEATLVALPQQPDPTYYSARDLDLYPRPVAPLELDVLVRKRSHAVTSFRYQVLIDESGTVNEVSAVEGGPAPLRDELRAVLVATRFVPGRKDGHAVKSRVTLSIDFDAARPDPVNR